MNFLYYTKNNNIELFKNFNNLDISNIQNYTPLYKKFFNLNDNNYNTMNLNNKYHIYKIINKVNENHYKIVITDGNGNNNQKDAFIKFSPLLDISKYMSGKYINNNKDYSLLPSLNDNQKCHKKVLDSNNSSYIDGFFSYLSSKLLNNYKFIHGTNFYGTFLGIKDELIANIDEDIEYLYNCEYFHNNNDKLFRLINFDEDNFFDNETRKYRSKINIKHDENISFKLDNLNKDNIQYDELFINNDVNHNELTEDNLKIHNINYNNLDTININIVDNSNNMTSVKDTNSTYSSRLSNTDSNDNSENLSDYNSSNSMNSSYNSSESIDDDVMAVIYKFPVNIIITEKLDNTLDSLLELEKKQINKDEWTSCLFQIIIMLITYQKYFDFTHNDLHTSNIMFTNTDKKFLYYKYNDTFYKVPTYGKIYKIIDFGRSIYKYNDKLLFSDSFHSKGDAATQYNYGPYYNEKRRAIPPNKSFDLCRLGCSLYDYFIDDISIEHKIKDPIKQLIIKWCKDDKGKNVLYKNNGDERYEDFKLYKMITRTVHNHIPSNEIKNPLFQKYIVKRKKINKNKHIMNIDKLIN